MPETIINLVCSHCGKIFPRTLAEYNRSKRVGRLSYCSGSCAASENNRKSPRSGNIDNLNSANRKDKFSPFRYAMKIVRARSKQNNRKSYDIDIEYLNEIWKKQHGKCPYTGWDLELPRTSFGWEDEPNTRRASLDRIDNSLGYVKGNVRFVSVMANYCRNEFDDENVIEFCNAVVNKYKNNTMLKIKNK